MPEVVLSAGTIEYSDTGGDGPVVVLLHGLTMDSSVWRNVMPELPPGHRYVLPTLPLGSHRKAMDPAADLSLPAMAGLVGEFLEELDLRDVTLVLNDWGGPQLLIPQQRDERIARLVISSCEAYDNYPPGLPGKIVEMMARLPGGLYLTFQLLRTTLGRRAPGGWGWMSKRPVPKDVMDRWFEPARTDKGVRRDLMKYSVSVPPKDQLLEYSQALAGFDRPVLVAWASEDKVMPVKHARRLAETFPDSRLVEIPDSYTLIPEDQPKALAQAISEFLLEDRTRS